MKKWRQLTLPEQMANIGSEVGRCLNWKLKNNPEYSRLAFRRSLELFDQTMAATRKYSRLKEIVRARELWTEYYLGANIYSQTPQMWERYFLAFNRAARN